VPDGVKGDLDQPLVSLGLVLVLCTVKLLIQAGFQIEAGSAIQAGGGGLGRLF